MYSDQMMAMMIVVVLSIGMVIGAVATAKKIRQEPTTIKQVLDVAEERGPQPPNGKWRQVWIRVGDLADAPDPFTIYDQPDYCPTFEERIKYHEDD